MISTLPKVSVCIPCYNAEPFLPQALESVLAQTYSNIEIVVVDDGSSDRSLEILERHRARGVRVVHQTNNGQSAAANRAFSCSTGRLIKFFDADDVLEANHIALQVQTLGARMDAIAIGEWSRFYRADPNEAIFPPPPPWKQVRPVNWLTEQLSDARPMMQCGLWLIPREVLNACGVWDERLSLINDFEFFIRVLCHVSEIRFTPGARIYYRSGLTNSLSGNKSRRAAESAYLSLILGTQHLLKLENSLTTRRACANVLKGFEYKYYPHHADLRARIRARVVELGGSDLPPDGPPGFQRLRRFVGWRVARHTQHIAEGLKLNRVARKTWFGRLESIWRAT
jgi:glycosyltransferase involved in cell wall biosynthesis